MAAVPRPAPHAETVAEVLSRLARLARGAQHRNGLNPAQWEALRYLARANRYSRSPKELSAFLGATKGTVSQTLIALNRKGLITRRRRPKDGRGLELELTAAGWTMLGADPLGRFAQAVANLPEGARGALLDNLVAVMREVQRLDGYAGFGVCRTCVHFCHGLASDEPGGPHRCGLTGEPLSPHECRQICAKHKHAA
jgi:DNA-binding MarR family transcriptional regulator